MKTTTQLWFPNHLALKANRAYICRTIAEKEAIVKGLESTPRWYAQFSAQKEPERVRKKKINIVY